jgi:transposase
MLVADKKDWQYTQSARILQLAISDLGKAWNNFFDKAQPGWGKPKFRSKAGSQTRLAKATEARSKKEFFIWNGQEEAAFQKINGVALG